MAHISAILAQNQAILMQIQSRLGLPPISPFMLAQASLVPPPAEPVPTAQPALVASLDLLAATTVAATPLATLVAPQPAQGEDDLPPATH